ncbi:CG43861 [Drosophila busckii]|uniref:CG43861 n=1 Tax=Drosophila busckii TaxID=30019 RepID=A0A0M4E757_DROBS|nr:CG43861 [Drosophila busckii]ALC40296.1 CG43861 [Drosophila busckii]
MACSIQKQQPNAAATATATSTGATGMGVGVGVGVGGSGAGTVPSTPKATKAAQPRGSLPTDVHHQPPLEFQWPPPVPVSSHTSNLRLNMMNQDPKDLHTARAIIEELRSKVRFQTEHIMKWRKAYALQVQQHYRYQKEKSDQMNALTSQLLLLESRLKRKQKQISSLLGHRELTIQRQQKIIDTLSTRLVDHGLETIEASYANELDSLNDSDSAVVLEDIDSDSNMTLGTRRKSSGGGCGGLGSDGITIVRSISDAIETNLNKYGAARRNNCFLRRPDILETVYSVEEDPEPTSDVAEKRDKFKNRSDKALSSSSTEGQIDAATPAVASATPPAATDKAKEHVAAMPVPRRQLGGLKRSPSHDAPCTTLSVKVPQLPQVATPEPQQQQQQQHNGKAQVTTYNRVMSNHRSVTKPKDVKYKRINKAKSKSLEELRGRLKNLVERPGLDAGYTAGMMPQAAQSYA